MRTSRSSPKNPDLKSPWFVYVILTLLALLSALGLDYINWRKGDTAYLFSLLSEREPEAGERISIKDLVVAHLQRQGISKDSIHQFKDRKNRDHVKVDIPLKKYAPLEIHLKEALRQAKASVFKKEEKEDTEKSYFLWEVEGKERDKLTILFACKKDITERQEDAPSVKPRSKVAIIMDDMGNSLEAIYDVLSLQRPITVAVLPHSPWAGETAQIAHQNGTQVLLHLPLESINNEEENNGIEGIITSEMTAQEIIDIVENNLDQVPYISGVNNHMGSKITPNEAMMSTILQRLKKRNLFFVDSRTTGKSVAYAVARRLRIPAAERHVFLDGKQDEDYIKEKLVELFTLAQKRGEAVGICHPMPETLEVLKKNFHLVEEFNVKPVFASEIVH